jgi:biotin operon repressor
MGNAQDIIIQLLSSNDCTINEIAESTGYSTSGIRSRVSELRRSGYDIVTTQNKPHRYHLVFKKNFLVSRIFDYIERSNLYNTKIDYQSLSASLGVSLIDVENAMIEIYKAGRLLQLSNSSAMILRKL